MTRILVVDDQRDVRTMICMVLRVKHFEVVEAGSAMREKVLELPVVAISGMTSLDAASHSVELSSLVCLLKPFRPNDLIGAIEAAQGSRPQADDGASVAARAV